MTLNKTLEELLLENNLQSKDIDAVSVSEGPGSYTGLRIGVSVAKGFCYAKNIPLIAVSTLQAMAIMAQEFVVDKNILFCPMIDARRMEVYSALFDSDATLKRGVVAEVIDDTSYSKELANTKIVFFGDGADKCKAMITDKNALFIPDIYPSAKYMAGLSQKAFDNNDFKDVAYFEPFYLKDFVALTSKKKLF